MYLTEDLCAEYAGSDFTSPLGALPCAWFHADRGLGAATPGVAAQIQAAAPAYGVPPALALAVAQRESGLNQAAVGTSGEIGVFQLMPATAAQLGVNPSDLSANISGGLRYLQQMYAQFGDWSLALEAYNGGASHVHSGTVSPAARTYSASVLAAAGLDSVDSTAPVESGGGEVALDVGLDASSGSGVSGPLVAVLALAAVGLVIWAAA